MCAVLLHLKNITKGYGLSKEQRVLNHLSLEVSTQEKIAILGTSGSGKSTLLHIMGLLDRPTQGDYFLEEHDTSTLTETERARLRNRYFGFVFQSFFLLPRLSALENVMLPLHYRGIERHESLCQSSELLSQLDLEAHQHKYPSMLSGGQQQRVAIARALIGNPRVILADEPTGALDSESSRKILDLLDHIYEKRKTSIIVVTHDVSVASRAEKIFRVRDGFLEQQQ